MFTLYNVRYCFMLLPLFVGVLCWFLFCYAYLSVLSSFEEEELVAFLYSKTCLKLPLKKKTKKGFQDRLLLNAGQKYYRMLILQYFRPSLSYHLSLRSLFYLILRGHLKQILLYLPSWCIVTDSVLWLFLTVPLAGV